MHTKYIAYIFDTLAGTLSNCFVYQLVAVNLLKMSASPLCKYRHRDAFFIHW